MNDTKFTNTAKQHKVGISYVVFADGVEIGTRKTSKRTGYKFAVVARRNHAHSLGIAKGNVAHGISELAKYRGYLANPHAAALAEKLAFHRDMMVKWIADGTVAGWITGLEKQMPIAETYLALRLSQTQDSPDFQKWSVVAFSNTGKDVPHAWMHNMRLVALTPPPQATLAEFRQNQPHMTAEEAKAQRDLVNQAIRSTTAPAN